MIIMQTIYFRINEEVEKQKQHKEEQLQRKLLEVDYNNSYYHSTVDMGHVLTQTLYPVHIPLTYRPGLSEDMQEHVESDSNSIFYSFISDSDDDDDHIRELSDEVIKSPGVRPIGICDIIRCIIARSVLSITRLDLLEASGFLQLCTGQIAGVEVGINAVRSCFNEESTEEVLLVDATNAFNSFNRNSALLNIRHLCLAITTVVISCYREPADLFVGETALK